MASTSAESSNTHQPIEQCNTQTTWLVPTKYKLFWKIEDVSNFTEIKSPKMSGPADTNFSIFLRIEDTANRNAKFFVEMQSFSARAPLKIKGEISVNNGENLTINRFVKKGYYKIKLLVDPVPVQNNNTLEVSLEFVSFPILNQFLKINKNAAQFGEKLNDFRVENIDNNEATDLSDCFLCTNAGKLFCHKAVLFARSPKFDLFLEKSDSILILDMFDDCDDSVVLGLLNYLYTGNPYKLIEKYPLHVLKKILKLGKNLEVSEIGSLFEKRKFSIVTKSHSCSSKFEVTMTNKEFCMLASERGSYKFPNFSFCKSEWNMEFIKDETFSIDLNKTSKENVTNVEVHIFYLNFQKEWVKLEKINDSKESDSKMEKSKIRKIKSYKKKKIEKEEENKKSGCKNTHFKFAIENEFVRKLFESPSCSEAGKFNKLILKCEIKHKKFYDNVDLKVKTLDAFRFLYDRLHFDSFSSDLKKLYDSKKYSDLKVTVVSSSLPPKKFQAHKIILAARSSIFKQKINESKDDEIEVKEVHSSLFEQFDQIIRFLYTNVIDFNAVPPLEAYEFGYINSVIDLMNSSREYFTNHYVSEINANNAMTVAIRCEDDKFKEDLKKYMSKHHSKKWNSDTNEFVLKSIKTMDTKDFKTKSTGTLDAYVLGLEANEAMDTYGPDHEDIETSPDDHDVSASLSSSSNED